MRAPTSLEGGIESAIALGTAQLGMAYGVANSAGQPSATRAAEIVAAALESGIRYFDTAQAYGESERILGDALAGHRLGAQAKVITKLAPHLADAPAPVIRDALKASFDRLRVAKLHGVLLHREEQLPALGGAAGLVFEELRDSGRLERIGVSVYNVAKAALALRTPLVSALQFAGNVFDRRVSRAGIVHESQGKRAQLFVRSAYLQGLTIMPLAQVPDAIPHAREAVRRLDEFCAARGFSRKTFAFGYARRRHPDATLVVGAETPDQIAENVALVSAPLPSSNDMNDWDALWPLDLEDLVNPSRWPAVKP